MARILYGISGDGFGHATRAKVAIKHLQEAGHELCLVSYDKGYDMLSKYFTVEKVDGPRLEYADNEVKYLATVVKNLMKSKATIKSMDKVRSLAKKFKPDLVITDFEPTVNLAANWLGLPLISLDNMHVITKSKVDVPERWLQEYLTTSLIIRLMVFNANKYIILSFFESEPNSAKAKIVSPIVRQEIIDLVPSQAEHVLVYLTAEDGKIIPILKDSRAKYIIYGFNRDGVEDNLTFRRFGSGPDYLQDLATARGIIATAGFSLLSEAFYLGKPYLAIPIRSQFEQLLNAHYLQKLGYGLMTENFDYEVLDKFLKELGSFSTALAGYRPQVNSQAMATLDLAIKELK